MSYILDALRKSEQERQVAAGQSSGLLAPSPTEHSPEKNKKAVWLAVILLLVLTLVSVNLWWWSRQPPSIPSASTPVLVSKSELPPAQPIAPSAPLPSAPTIRVQPIAKPAISPAPSERKQTTIPTPPSQPAAKPVASSPKGADKAVRIGSTETRPQAESSPQAKAPPSTHDLPSGLPAISISGYIKDQTGSNLAIINDKLVREGEEISPGLRLEKIDGEQAILNFRGQRFRR